jgi:hypothetical protein
MASFKIADRFMRGLEGNGDAVFCRKHPRSCSDRRNGKAWKTLSRRFNMSTPAWAGCSKRSSETGGAAIVTASHGGSEEMTKKASGDRSYRATRNPVPFHLIDRYSKVREIEIGRDAGRTLHRRS